LDYQRLFDLVVDERVAVDWISWLHDCLDEIEKVLVHSGLAAKSAAPTITYDHPLKKASLQVDFFSCVHYIVKSIDG